VNTAVVVSIVSAAGIIGSTLIQALNTRGANNRADRAREDERKQEEQRRKEERDDAAQQRAEARAAEEARQAAEHEAAMELAEQERIAQKKEERRRASVAFLGQAEKCYRLMRLAPTKHTAIANAVSWPEWHELSRLLGEVVVTVDHTDSRAALDVVDALQEATNPDSQKYAEGMKKAEGSLRTFAELVRDD